MASLFNINKEYLELAAIIEDNEGEVQDTEQLVLESNEANFEDKCKNYLAMIRKWESEVEAAKSEQERISKYVKTRSRAINSLKEGLDGSLRIRGMEKLDLGVFGKLSYRKSERLSIHDDDQIPEVWWKEKISRSIDKAGIKKAIKSGEDVEGAFIETFQNLQIA